MTVLSAVYERATWSLALALRPGLERRIVFHHVPKCGGTSITQAIERSFGRRRLRRSPHRIDAQASARAADDLSVPPATTREQLLAYSLSLPTSFFVSGHIQFSERLHDLHAAEWDLVTVLRHPVDRWFSQYRYNRSKTEGHYRHGLDLRGYLASEVGQWTGHTMTRYFVGEAIDRPPTEEEIDRAASNLRRHFAVVGRLEDLESFAADFQSTFGPRLMIPHENVNTSPTEEIDAELRREIEQVCRADIEFYERIFTRSTGA